MEKEYQAQILDITDGFNLDAPDEARYFAEIGNGTNSLKAQRLMI